MPTIANLALKDAAAAAVVGTALTGSPGDGQPAKWRIESTKPVNCRPTLTLSTRDNAAKNARVAKLTAVIPYTVLVNGIETVIAAAPKSMDFVLPTNVPQSHLDYEVAIMASFLNDPGIVAALKATYAPS